MLVERGVPVLSETPPAPEVADVIDLWEYVEDKGEKVCVAEQYFLQPYYAAVRAGHNRCGNAGAGVGRTRLPRDEADAQAAWHRLRRCDH